MGFMDKAKQMAQQVQQEAKDGTLKERAKQMADQAQQKLDDVQGQFNAGQQGGGQAGAGAGAPVEYDQQGRPVQGAAAPQPMADPDPAPAAAQPEPVAEAESATPPAGDPLADEAGHPPAPKEPPSSGSGMTSGDPLAG
ncbi:MAG: hypothetical protein V9E83_13305 [Baekduia sp.]